MREVPYLRVANVQRGYLDLAEVKWIFADEHELEALRLQKGDILFTEGGDRDKLGRGWVWNDEIEECIHQNHIFRARPRLALVNPKFVSYHGNYFGQDWFTKTGRQTTNLASINKGVLSRFPVPLAPLNEQRRIVAKIEELFSDLDAGVVVLERVRANLKRYRAAVLKAAVEGKLTEDWRAQQPDTEPASVLLDRILTERRRDWERDQLAKFAQAGKQSPNGWEAKYRAPLSHSESELSELPAGWTWASSDQLCSQVTDGEHNQPKYQPSGFPMLTATHVRDGFVDPTGAGLISKEHFDLALKRCAPQEGDILIVSVGATTGRSAIVGKLEPFALVRSVLLLKPLLSGRVLLNWIRSPWCQKWISRASGATAQAHLYINDTKRMPVALPPVAEAEVIHTEVERHLSIVEEIEAQVDANLRRAARLRQGILKRAFEGRLVPHDPTDEPAEMLLERIRRALHPCASSSNESPQTPHSGQGSARRRSQSLLRGLDLEGCE